MEAGAGIGRFLVMNDLLDAEEQEDRPMRRFYSRENPFDLTDNKFIKLFRLSKDLVRNLIVLLGPFIQPPTRSSSLSMELKVLVALRFFGFGSYQEITGSSLFLGISQPSVCRCIKEVCDALNRNEILNNWVRFPRNQQELVDIRNRFYEKYHFPGIVGVIDCTHVAIAPPYGQDYPEHIYVNRKNYHSINVQLICDENLRIMSVDARFPGSCHDAHIWRQSNVAPVMEQVYRNNPNNLFFLLGDSGYPLRPWLQTSLQNQPANNAEQFFDNRLKSIRSTIERCNGVLKNRFRCLLKHRVLHYLPLRASSIINACVILHNMCLEANIPEPDQELNIDVDFGIYEIEENELPAVGPIRLVNPDLAAARRIQQQIAANHFNNNHNY